MKKQVTISCKTTARPSSHPTPNDTKNVSKNSLYHAISKLRKRETKRLDIKKNRTGRYPVLSMNALQVYLNSMMLAVAEQVSST